MQKSSGDRPAQGGGIHARAITFTYPTPAPAPTTRIEAEARLRQALPRPIITPAVLEVATSITGVCLGAFMIMHLGLLSSVLIGAQSMDSLAGFLERYYLLQAAAPVLILIGLGHILFTARKVPTTWRQQQSLLREMRWLRHFDTWTWAIQIVTGVAILAIAAIHLWVILTGLPILADKSGARVFGMYLWLYIPFILLVEAHTSSGLYRVAVKWGLFSRRTAHLWLGLWTIAVLALGFAILATFYGIGAGL